MAPEEKQLALTDVQLLHEGPGRRPRGSVRHAPFSPEGRGRKALSPEWKYLIPVKERRSFARYQDQAFCGLKYSDRKASARL
jgi:hypothetical protein